LLFLHDLKTLQVDPIAHGIDVVVSGHSHVPKIDNVGGVLYLNPGSAGRRRFRLPITLATRSRRITCGRSSTISALARMGQLKRRKGHMGRRRKDRPDPVP
jgi:2',3'-cyclic-nucleotide 2'-phosphodiesterase (5'-nucleotidase family)